MGSFGKITRLADLPADEILTGYIHKAMRLNESGIKAPNRSKPKVARELVVPEILTAALSTIEAARTVFEKLGPRH